jgi:uncharacterized membrane protein
LSEWLNLTLRWFHVFAGILWIGTTYYFTWLDARLREEESAGGDDPAQVWMVHSGGFYVVEKRKVPGTRELHWFRWEAALTWLSGFALLVLVYYYGGALVDPDVTTTRMGIAISVATLIVGWVVYDLLAHRRLRPHRHRGLRSLAEIERARDIHTDRRDLWHDHGGERVDANLASAAAYDRGDEARREV